MNNVNLIKEVDALTTSKQRMYMLEKKYNLSSKKFWENNYDPLETLIDEDDLDFWRFYIECFLDCGGSFDTQDDGDRCNEIQLRDIIFTTQSGGISQ